MDGLPSEISCSGRRVQKVPALVSKIMKGGKTMNKGTKIFFGAIGLVFVLIVFAIGRQFGWW